MTVYEQSPGPGSLLEQKLSQTIKIIYILLQKVSRQYLKAALPLSLSVRR